MTQNPTEWLPGAVHLPLPDGVNNGDIRTRFDGAILHTAASNGTGRNHYDYWRRNPHVRVSSHFYVEKDGTKTQLLARSDTAWTSVAGSWRTLGIETQGWNSEPWTPEQIVSIAEIIAWDAALSGYPLRQMASTARSERGIGYHETPYGGEVWNPNDHACPGALRVAQIPAIIATAKPPQEKDQEMQIVTLKGKDSQYLVTSDGTMVPLRNIPEAQVANLMVAKRLSNLTPGDFAILQTLTARIKAAR